MPESENRIQRTRKAESDAFMHTKLVAVGLKTFLRKRDRLDSILQASTASDVFICAV